jgi:pyochelin synthetase
MSDLQNRVAKLSPEQRALLALRLTKHQAASSSRATRLAEVRPDPAHKYDPFPLTDLQQAYWIGRSGAFEIGQVAGHSYLEIESDELDIERLNHAWRRLIDRHDMLRAIILPDGRQQVLKSVPPYAIKLIDLRQQTPEASEAQLQEIRQRMSHQVLPSDQWPLFDIRAIVLDKGRIRLCISLDALIIDGWSIALLFREWSTLYQSEAELAPLDLTFRDYVLAERALEDTEIYRRDRDYWRSRLETLPAGPDLPLALNPTDLTECRFVRRTGGLDPHSWQRLKERANRAELTPTSVLLAAYAHVLAVWSKTSHFTLNVPQFNRLPLHPAVNSIIGEAASFSLVEVDITDGSSFEERAKRIQQRLWEDLDHSYFSGVRVLRELTKLQEQASGVLMPVIFTGAPQNSDGSDAYATNTARQLGEVVYAINQTPQVWLDNHVSEQQGALICDWDTVETLFHKELSEAMFHAYLQLLKRLAHEEGCWRQSWPEMAKDIVPPEHLERRAAVNKNEALIPNILLQDLFIAQVPERNTQPAVISPARTLSYGELYGLANQWGHRLRELGVRPNHLVAVVMEKGWEQVVASLGILQAGAAYAPLDPYQPPERLWQVLNDSQAEYVLTQSWLDEQFEWPMHVQRFRVDQEDLSAFDPVAPEHAQGPDDLAFVIYTSGSTGQPKGVMIGHRGVVNSVVCTNQTFNTGPGDRVLAIAALHHDLSVYDLFGVLGAGGTIIMPEPAGRRDPAHWSELMQRHQVTLWNSVPAMMEMLLEYADSHPRAITSSLRLAFLGGDWIPVTLPDRLKRHVENAYVVSTGGPTETTLWNIWYPVKAVDPAWKSIPYGKPIANTRYYVLNDVLESCPDWVPGELCCVGVGLAKGYWQDPEKTAAKFIQHPRTGERIYRTGDRGCYLPDGNILFLGRTDFQIKLQGQRIEAGEIEATLVRHADVRAAVVVAVGDNSGKKRLVAYVVPVPNTAPSMSELRQFLGQKLPDYMVPSAFVFLERLPLTANGKVDRRALPLPQEGGRESAQAAPDEGSSLKSRIGELVKGILGSNYVDPEANLIALGANSIDMVRIGNQIEQSLGIRPRMDQIFRLQTVSAIATYCQQQLGHVDTSPKGGNMGLEAELQSIIKSFKPLRNPEEREAFKNSQLGLRRGDEHHAFTQLVSPVDDEALRKKYAETRSHRRFGLKPILFEQFSQLLSCLYQITLNGKPKYLYPSPGGLYPTQTYLHIKPGRIEGVQAGTYYYHPAHHCLVSLTPNVEINRSIHVPFVNTPIFDEAAFSIFFVTQLAAIAPSYGERSIFFATLEAGGMAYLLQMWGQACGLGLCQIGGVDFEKIRPLFLLDKSHHFIHSMLGGPVYSGSEEPKATENARAEEPLAKMASLLKRMKQLSEQEVKALLDGHRSVDNGGDSK